MSSKKEKMQSREEREEKLEVQNNISIEEIERWLESEGFVFAGNEIQLDEYWDTKDCKIMNLKRGLRVRYSSDAAIKSVEFKSLFKRNNGTYFIEEIDLWNKDKINESRISEVLNGRLNISRKNIVGERIGIEILSDWGLEPEVVFKKTRHIWNGNGVEVSIDEVNDLGIYVEVESKGNLFRFDQVLNGIKKWSDGRLKNAPGSYLDILFEKNKAISSKEEFENKFAKQYDWNVTDLEKVYVEKMLA